MHVSVFGSFARGEAGPDSDIDLLIITTATAELAEEWVNQVQALADRVLAWTGNRLAQLTLTVDRLQEVARAGEPIVTSWLNEAITVSGASLESLLDDASAAGLTRR